MVPGNTVNGSSHLKHISLVLEVFLCLYSCHKYLILLQKSEKHVTERNKTEPLTEETSS